MQWLCSELMHITKNTSNKHNITLKIMSAEWRCGYCQRFVEQWQEMLAKNAGGTLGAPLQGKTFF